MHRMHGVHGVSQIHEVHEDHKVQEEREVPQVSDDELEMLEKTFSDLDSDCIVVAASIVE